MKTILEIKVSLTVLKPLAEVYECIADPENMSGYFIAKGSGRLESNTVVDWTFPEMDFSFPVKVLTSEPSGFLSFTWGAMDGSETQVDIELKEIRPATTQVRITEGKKELDDASLVWYKQNTEGWANFLCCLKAYAEYGINLRKGAFEKDQMPAE